MRHSMLIILIALQGCSQKYCEQLDLSKFAAQDTALYCDQRLLSDNEMKECVERRDEYPRSFHQYYGLDGPLFIYEYPSNKHLIDEQLLTEFGTYLLAVAFDVSAVEDATLLAKSEAIANYLLASGVDPFSPYKTEMAPVAWLIPNALILRSVPATEKMWTIVKRYYPPAEHELSQQVDLYLRYCKQK
ncbi:hypothetical protein Q3O59_09540 [Alkalimonas delamerensis]|uniref:DUF4136 domain-containing protein n=1 Tax=Alkalimonas delamerensis TaxID=265981 RepID=A0ABT9GQN1_9GAMM|nr:hypothetical protein [Alkalimonas delamerensis]MDP4529274.1 hypothetical protein [Alkalimonas delamerensis]